MRHPFDLDRHRSHWAPLLAIPKRRRICASCQPAQPPLRNSGVHLPAEHVLILGDQRYNLLPAWPGWAGLPDRQGGPDLVGLLFSLNFMWNAFSNRFKTTMYFNSLSLVITALWVAVMALDHFYIPRFWFS